MLISDLSGCEPRAAIGAGLRDGCWYTLAYATAGGIAGVMVGMTEQSRPPDLRLPLPVTGWHAIYLGLYRGGIEPGQPFSDPFGLDVRLAGEPHAELVRPSVVDGARMNASIAGSGGAIEEVFWKAGDLAGEELVIACPGVEAPSAAQLAFVRLVPMSVEEVAEYTGAGSDPATKLIIAQLDGHSGSSFFDGARTVDDLLSIYAPLADSDVGTLFLGTGGSGAGSTFYPSSVGVPYGEGEEAFVSERAARTVRSLRGFLERGIDPVQGARGLRAGDGDRRLPGIPHGDDGRAATELHPLRAILARAPGAALPGQRRPHGGAAEHGLPGGAPLLRRPAPGAGRVRRGGRAAHLHAAGAVRALRAAGDRGVPGRPRRRPARAARRGRPSRRRPAVAARVRA